MVAFGRFSHCAFIPFTAFAPTLKTRIRHCSAAVPPSRLTLLFLPAFAVLLVLFVLPTNMRSATAGAARSRSHEINLSGIGSVLPAFGHYSIPPTPDIYTRAPLFPGTLPHFLVPTLVVLLRCTADSIFVGALNILQLNIMAHTFADVSYHALDVLRLRVLNWRCALLRPFGALS